MNRQLWANNLVRLYLPTCGRALLILLITMTALNPVVSATQTDTSAIRDLFIRAMQMQDYDPDSALLLAKEGYRQSKAANYISGEAMAYMRFASVMNTRGQNDSALLYYHRALQIRRKLNDQKGASGTCKQISYVYRDLGKKDSAFYYLYEALRFTGRTDSPGMAIIYVELADLNMAYKDFQAAENYLNRSLPIFEIDLDTIHIYQAYTGFGMLYFHKDHYQKALQYFFKAEALNRYMNNPVFRAKELSYIGLCYQELKKYTQARQYLSNAVEQYIELELPNELALAYFNLGNLFIDLRQPDEAIANLQQGLLIADEVKDLQRSARCLELLSDAYALKGDYKQAYAYHVRYNTLNDSLLDMEKVKQIAEMSAIYQTEKNEQEIVLLNEQNKTKLAQRNFFIAGSMVLMLGLLVSGFYFIQKNKLARKNERIAQQEIAALLNEQEIRSYNAMIEGQEEERKRIASDLHDRLGNMLSTVKLLFSSADPKAGNTPEENTVQYRKANELLDEACIEVRRISHNLGTGMVSSFGLSAALEELCERINSSGLIRCKLLVFGIDERLDTQTEISIYRMIQEIFNNILRHAGAQQITVQLNRLDTQLNITVEDNGTGFDAAEKKETGGMGLNNLRARAARLNGTYHIDSQPGKGSISIIEIPVNKQEPTT